jgi:hypothetical protein
MVSITVPYVCPVFSIWFEYPELLIVASDCLNVFFISGLKCFPVCPMYFSGQSRHLIWLYLSVCVWDFSIFCIEFYVRKAILICVSLKSLVIFFM